jgi:predicted DNA-binding transcriptional regulator AlpA
VPEDLVGITEIAEFLQLSRQRVHKLLERDDFPTPVAEIAAGRIWKRSDVEKWAEKTGRL